MEEDILAELDRQLTNVNLDKYWTRKVGDYELWLTSIDYVQSNRVKKVLEGEFGLEEAQRVTLSAAIVGVNGVDLRPLRSLGKTIKARGKDGKAELVDLPEYVYRKVAGWDSEFIDVVFRVYSDVMESHRKDLVKDIVFENIRSPEEDLADLEEKAASLRERLGMPPLVEARRLDAEPDAEPQDAEPQDAEPQDAEDDVRTEPERGPVAPGSTVSVGDESDFDPFEAVRAVAARVPPPASARPAPEPVPPSPVPPAAPVPVPPAAFSQVPSTPSEIQVAMARRGSSSPLAPSVPNVVLSPVAQPSVLDGVRSHVAQPSVLPEVVERPSVPSVVDPPGVNPHPGSQSRNPRFRRTSA